LLEFNFSHIGEFVHFEDMSTVVVHHVVMHDLVVVSSEDLLSEGVFFFGSKVSSILAQIVLESKINFGVGTFLEESGLDGT